MLVDRNWVADLTRFLRVRCEHSGRTTEDCKPDATQNEMKERDQRNGAHSVRTRREFRRLTRNHGAPNVLTVSAATKKLVQQFSSCNDSFLPNGLRWLDGLLGQSLFHGRAVRKRARMTRHHRGNRFSPESLRVGPAFLFASALVVSAWKTVVQCLENRDTATRR
jgi:hypothetical protein